MSLINNASQNTTIISAIIMFKVLISKNSGMIYHIHGNEAIEGIEPASKSIGSGRASNFKQFLATRSTRVSTVIAINIAMKNIKRYENIML